MTYYLSRSVGCSISLYLCDFYPQRRPVDFALALHPAFALQLPNLAEAEKISRLIQLDHPEREPLWPSSTS